MKRKFIYISIIATALIGVFVYAQSGEALDKSVQIDNIIIEKGNRTLKIYSADRLIKTYSISLGQNSSGDKEFEGDKKTPEGQYVINDKSANSAYHKNLGISYPNAQDIEHAESLGKKTGWRHQNTRNAKRTRQARAGASTCRLDGRLHCGYEFRNGRTLRHHPNRNAD